MFPACTLLAFRRVFALRSSLDIFRSQHPNMPGQLDGKVAVVTGAVGGFGSGIVAKYLEEGASIIAWCALISHLGVEADSSAGTSSKRRYKSSPMPTRADWYRSLVM